MLDFGSRIKKSFIDVLNASQSAEISGVVDDIIGSGGSKGMLNTLMEQARHGSRSERLFLLYAIKKQDVDDQMDWLAQLFEMSEMELRVTILEHIFENDLFDFEPSMHDHELTESFKNWLVTRCFVNYPKMQNRPLFAKLKAELRETSPTDNAVRYMMKYMFEDKKKYYMNILESIKERKRLEDDELIDSIIESYRIFEDKSHLEWFKLGKTSSPQVMAYYDEAIQYKALHRFLTNTNYNTLRKVVQAYDYDVIMTQLDKPNRTIIEWLCLAEAERQAHHSYTHFNQLMKALHYIISLELSMDERHITAQFFLKYELEQIRLSVESVLVDQTLDRGHVNLAGRSYEYLSNSKRRPVLIEMIRGVKRDKWTECLIDLLETELDNCILETTEFKIGDKGGFINALIAYNRGEDMDDARKKRNRFHDCPQVSTNV